MSERVQKAEKQLAGEFVVRCPHPVSVGVTVVMPDGWYRVPNYCPRCGTAVVWERRR